MENLQEIQGWVHDILYTEVHGMPLLAALTTAGRATVGDWVLDARLWTLGQLAGVTWFLAFAWAAVKLDQRGRWAAALGCFAIGYEIMWLWSTLLFIFADRNAQYLVVVLPLTGWTFTVVSALTAVKLLQHGVKKAVFGLPGLLLIVAARYSWLEKLGVVTCEKKHPPAYTMYEGNFSLKAKETA